MKRFGAFMWAVLVAGATVRAADPAADPWSEAAIGRRYALVIGISDYPHFTPLPAAVKDAAAIAERAQARGYDQVTLLTNAAATAEGIRQAMQEFRGVLTTNDAMAIFFAGHGQRVASGDDAFEGYLIPYDCAKDRVAEQGIPMQRFGDYIASMPNPYITLVIDACHAGSIGDAVNVDRVHAGMPRHIRVFSSTEDHEVAFESGGEHGLFTDQLLKRLPATHEVLDSEGAREVAAGVKAGVQEETGGWQTPRHVTVGGKHLRMTDRELED